MAEKWPKVVQILSSEYLIGSEIQQNFKFLLISGQIRHENIGIVSFIGVLRVVYIKFCFDEIKVNFNANTGSRYM